MHLPDVVLLLRRWLQRGSARCCQSSTPLFFHYVTFGAANSRQGPKTFIYRVTFCAMRVQIASIFIRLIAGQKNILQIVVCMAICEVYLCPDK
jgi:hypothetical protein